MENQRKNLFYSLSRTIRRRLSSSSRTKSAEAPAVCHQIEDTMVINEPQMASCSTEGEERVSEATEESPTPSQAQRDPAAAAELIHFHAAAVSLLQNNNIYVNFSTPGGATMANERRELAKHGFYWGSITLSAAQRKLNGKPNGSFLVRDSHTGPFQFSISFRTLNSTLHTRIDFIGGYWTIFADRRYRTMVDLIEDTMKQDGILCYVPSATKLGPDFPIQLIHPVSRFVESSLQHLCRISIRGQLEKTGKSIDEHLPLPKLLVEYLKESPFDVL